MAKPRDEGRADSTVRQDPRLPISLREASSANTPEIPDTSNSVDSLMLAKINYTSIAQACLLIIDVRSSLSRKWVTFTSLYPKEIHFGLVSLILLQDE